jgi:hypothetical protein
MPIYSLTAAQKLKLFWTVMTLIHLVKDLIASVETDGKPVDEAERPLLRALEDREYLLVDCHRLFGPDLSSFVQPLYSHAEQLRVAYHQRERPDTPAGRQAAQHDIARIAAWFRGQDEQAMQRFQPHLPLRIPTADDIRVHGAAEPESPPS